jgi:uncharacterized protein HemX
MAHLEQVPAATPAALLLLLLLPVLWLAAAFGWACCSWHQTQVQQKVGQLKLLKLQQQPQLLPRELGPAVTNQLLPLLQGALCQLLLLLLLQLLLPQLVLQGAAQ